MIDSLAPNTAPDTLTAEFPALEFRLDGEPSAIKASADRWASFGHAAGEAAAQIRSLDSTLFVGPEGDQYRAGLNHDLPPHLDTTAKAYTAVATSLTTYSSTLTGLQDRMAPLRTRAPGLWADLREAQRGVSAADQSRAEQAWNQCLSAARGISAMFETTDETVPSNWVVRLEPDGLLEFGPRDWLRRGFREDYYDDKPEALVQYERELAIILGD